MQDNWRINPKLTINLGLRSEWEGGATERYNRMIAGFDPTLSLPITAAAQAAYAASPIPELADADFKVAGGTLYTGKDRPRNLFKNELMWLPRLWISRHHARVRFREMFSAVPPSIANQEGPNLARPALFITRQNSAHADLRDSVVLVDQPTTPSANTRNCKTNLRIAP